MVINQGLTPFLLAVLLSLTPGIAIADSGPAALLPDRAEGWERQGPDGVYGPENLFDLIDGAAEVYLAFNVRRVVSRRYISREGADIIADVFDMGLPKDAFGAYHFDMREGEDAGIGAESELVGSSLAFWKDRFFVALTPLDDNPEIRRAVLSLGRQIEGAVTGEGSAPDLVTFLPTEGLVRSQVHYFHDDRILSLLVPVSGKNLLGLNRNTEGIIARYRLEAYPGTQPVLLMVRYPGEEEARRGAEALESEIRSAREKRGNGDTALRWSEVRREGTLLVAVLRGAGRDQGRALVEEALSKAVPKGKADND